MRRISSLILAFSFFAVAPAWAVLTNGGVDITPPTDANIPDWDNGWAEPGITGWNYVGRVGTGTTTSNFSSGASGVYIGNGWVLTAAHIGAGNFLLGSTVYTMQPGTARYVTPMSGGVTEDLYLFKIENAPSLPSLTLSSSLPVAYSPTEAGSKVAFLGFGSSVPNLSWGYNTVTETDEEVDLRPSAPFVSQDFFTDSSFGTPTQTNPSVLAGGDSGGGAFIYDSATRSWQLAGINEIIGQYENSDITLSGFVQLDDYATQISDITGIEVAPEPSTWLLLSLGIVFVVIYSRRRT